MTQPAKTAVRFLDYALDAANAELRRHEEPLSIRPKTLAVLNHLVDQADRRAHTAVGEWEKE